MAAKKNKEINTNDLVTIIKKITDTYHTYELKGKPILKRTYWYMMISEFEGMSTFLNQPKITHTLET